LLKEAGVNAEEMQAAANSLERIKEAIEKTHIRKKAKEPQTHPGQKQATQDACELIKAAPP
jgi:hypothetical protein